VRPALMVLRSSVVWQAAVAQGRPAATPDRAMFLVILWFLTAVTASQIAAARATWCQRRHYRLSRHPPTIVGVTQVVIAHAQSPREWKPSCACGLHRRNGLAQENRGLQMLPPESRWCPAARQWCTKLSIRSRGKIEN